MTVAYLVDTDWAVHWLHVHEHIQRRMAERGNHGLARSALQHNLTLLTNNRRHFENIESLRIESLS